MNAIRHAGQTMEEWRFGVRTRRIAAACDGTTALCIFEQWVDPGAGAPTHSHAVEEVLTVIDGRAEIWLGREHMDCAAGSSVVIPAGAKHGFRNIGTTLLHMHAVLASPFFEANFDEGVGLVRRWNSEQDP